VLYWSFATPLTASISSRILGDREQRNEFAFIVYGLEQQKGAPVFADDPVFVLCGSTISHQIRNLFQLYDLEIGMVNIFLDLGRH
jgi:hypothetical protein